MIWVGKDSSKFQALMPISTTTTVRGSWRSSSSLVVVGTKPTNFVRGSEIEVYVMRRRVEGPELGVSVPASRRLHGFQYYGYAGTTGKWKTDVRAVPWH
jgi:hypothetical protein